LSNSSCLGNAGPEPGRHGDIVRAFTSAGEARFEHGETPTPPSILMKEESKMASQQSDTLFVMREKKINLLKKWLETSKGKENLSLIKSCIAKQKAQIKNFKLHWNQYGCGPEYYSTAIRHFKKLGYLQKSYELKTKRNIENDSSNFDIEDIASGVLSYIQHIENYKPNTSGGHKLKTSQMLKCKKLIADVSKSFKDFVD